MADCRAIPTVLSSLQICITEKITEDSPGYTVARYITVTDSASKLGDDGGNWEAILGGNLTSVARCQPELCSPPLSALQRSAVTWTSSFHFRHINPPFEMALSHSKYTTISRSCFTDVGRDHIQG